MYLRSLLAALLVASLSFTCVHAQNVPQNFAVKVIHEKPGAKSLGFAFLPDERILVIGHQNGEVRLLVDGEMRAEPVGTIPDLATSSERGLLGIAVDPDWPEAPFLYLYYTSGSGYNRVSRFRLDGALNDPTSDDLAIDLSSEEILLAFQDDSEYHNAGTLRFGADNTLYVSHGDDLNHGEDDENYLQALTNPYGKIFRIHRDGTIPDDNPSFPAETDGRLPGIFAVGLRNPFRFAIDPHTGRLFIGDVGSTLREEFDLSVGGENFGYSRHEGDTLFRAHYPLIAPDPTPPIYSYHTRPGNHAAIALATYRSKSYPRDNSFPEVFDGVHFYADYFNGSLRYLRPDGSNGWESVSFGTGFNNLTDAAIGPDGSLYLITYNGPLRKIVYENPNVAAEDRPVTADLELRQNHPNPFRGSTTITYRLGRADHVRMDVFDTLGRRVARLVDAWQSAGIHAVRFDGGGLAAGIYVCRLQTGGATSVKTILRQ